MSWQDVTERHYWLADKHGKLGAMNFIESLQNFVLGLPEPVQFIGVALAAMVPFVENYGAVVIGSVAGIPIWVVVLMAIVGNLAVVALITLISGRTRDVIMARKHGTAELAVADSPSKIRVRKLFDRYGIPGVTLLGMLFVPTHLIAATLVSFGLSLPRQRDQPFRPAST